MRLSLPARPVPLSPRLRATAPGSAWLSPGCGPWAGAAPPGPTCARRLERGRRTAGGCIPPFLSLFPPTSRAAAPLTRAALRRDSLQVGAGTVAGAGGPGGAGPAAAAAGASRPVPPGRLLGFAAAALPRCGPWCPARLPCEEGPFALRRGGVGGMRGQGLPAALLVSAAGLG